MPNMERKRKSEKVVDGKALFDRVWAVATTRGIVSYKELGDLTGLSPSVFSLVARGKRNLSPKSIRTIANALGVSREYVETGQGEEPAEVRMQRAGRMPPEPAPPGDEQQVTITLTTTTGKAARIMQMLTMQVDLR